MWPPSVGAESAAQGILLAPKGLRSLRAVDAEDGQDPSKSGKTTRQVKLWELVFPRGRISSTCPAQQQTTFATEWQALTYDNAI